MPTDKNPFTGQHKPADLTKVVTNPYLGTAVATTLQPNTHNPGEPLRYGRTPVSPVDELTDGRLVRARRKAVK